MGAEEKAEKGTGNDIEELRIQAGTPPSPRVDEGL